MKYSIVERLERLEAVVFGDSGKGDDGATPEATTPEGQERPEKGAVPQA